MSTFAPPVPAREKVAEIPAVLDTPAKVESAAELSGAYAQLLGGSHTNGSSAYDGPMNGGSAVETLDAEPPIDGEAPLAASAPQPEVSLDWPLEPSRPWLKLVGAAATIAALAVGGWFMMGRGASSGLARSGGTVTSSSAASIPADVPPPLAEAEKASSGVPPVRDEESRSAVSDGLTPAPAAVASKSESGSQAAVPSHRFRVEPAAPEPKPADTEEPPPEPTLPALRSGALPIPSVNKVDAITQMIEDSARRRADSVEHTIQVKPPTFKSPRGGPSSPR